MDVEALMEEMRQIQKEYPNFYNPHLPATVCCLAHKTDEHYEGVRKPFVRTCPNEFEVKDVNMYKGVYGCHCIVTYTLRYGELPEEPKLEGLVSGLLKHAPANAIILKDLRLLELPKDVVVPYAIFCECPKKIF